MRPLNLSRSARLLILCLDQDLLGPVAIDHWAAAALENAEAPRWLIDIRHACTKDRGALLAALSRNAEPVASLETALAFLALLYQRFQQRQLTVQQCNAILHTATSRVQIPGEFRYLSGAVNQACRTCSEGYLSEQRAAELATDLLHRYAGFSRLLPAALQTPAGEAVDIPRAAVA